MKKILLGLIAALALTANLGATTLCSDGVVDVLTLNAGGGCTLGDFTFSNFTVADNDPNQTASIGILSGGTQWLNGVAYIQFSVSHLAAPLDIFLDYDVTANNGSLITGIDLELGTSTPPIRIIESATDEEGGSLADIQVRKGIPGLSNILYAEAFFEGQSFVHISKDIQLQQDTSSISDFINSHHGEPGQNEVPEPGTYAMMGAGLLALAAIRRRKA